MIYIIWGPPGAGKSYYATRWAVSELNRTGKRAKKVYSNYPIVQKKKNKVLSSYKWKPELVYENIYNSIVFIDEAYRDYNSRDYRNFTDDLQVFFSTQRHNDDDLVLISPNPARIDKVIREMTNLFIYIIPHRFLIFRTPIYFTAESFLSFEDFPLRFKNPAYVYGKEHYFYQKKISRCYDTKQFRNESEEYVPELWYNAEDESINDEQTQD